VPLEVRATDEDPDSVIRPYAYQKHMAAVMRDQHVRDAMFEWFRQAGKSLGGSIGINDDVLTAEAQGQRRMWVLISRTLAQARELSLKVRHLARAIAAAKKVLLPVRYNERYVLDPEEHAFELEYPGHSRVLCVSSNPDAAAGYTSNIWWDEVGLTAKAKQLFGAAFGVTTRSGLRFLMTSTPRPGFWNRRWDEALKSAGVIHTDHLTIHGGIAQGCPLHAEEIRLRLRDDLKWREDYLCEHIDDDVCWLPWELIVGATDARCHTYPELSRQRTAGEISSLVAARTPPEPESDISATFAGWDVARWQNLSVLYVLQRTGGLLLTQAIVVMQRMPFEQQLALVGATLAGFPRFARLCVDATGMGEMVAEQAQRKFGRVEAVKITGPLKEVLAGDLRRLLEDRTLRLPDDDALRSDLHSVHRTMTAAGNPRFEGEAEGSHADRFWAASLAVHAAITPGGGLTSEGGQTMQRLAAGLRAHEPAETRLGVLA
jgi:phage FluMu gp28-like protein